MEFAGFLRHFADLDDARKWRAMRYIFDMNQPPPQEAYDRCARFDRFTLHLGSPIASAGMHGDRVHLTTDRETSAFDFVILGTGFAVDVGLRPELARFADRIARWSDRYTPAAGDEHPVLAGFPYLSDAFQFTERRPGDAPFLRHLFCYTFGAMPSLANSAGISQLKFGVERLASGVTRELFVDDADRHLASLFAYAEPELDAPERSASAI
jgi:cation diffusion facilitator CzcD-associated flavoprotein CzcO